MFWCLRTDFCRSASLTRDEMVAFKSCGILKVQIVASLVVSVVAGDDFGNKNSITPLKAKSNSTTSGVSGCPSLDGLLSSPCKLPCQTNDDCINHINFICCPAVSGSKCAAECVSPTVLNSGSSDKVCQDHATKKWYKKGETFMRSPGFKCCKCIQSGIVNCSDSVLWCQQGCMKGKQYFRNGEIVMKSSCKNCTCQNRNIVCYSVKGCSRGVCKYKGKVYKEGDELHVDHGQGCKQCICRASRWECEALTCQAVFSGSDSSTQLQEYFIRTLLRSLFLVSVLLRGIN